MECTFDELWAELEDVIVDETSVSLAIGEALKPVHTEKIFGIGWRKSLVSV